VGNVFSAISGQFGKAFIVGALLPATIFAVLFYLFVTPMVPLELRALPIVRSIDTQWQLGLLIAFSTVAGALLYVLNTSIIRMYEGYPWQYGDFGERMKKLHRAKLDKLKQQRKDVKDLLQRIRADHPQYKTVRAYYHELLRRERNEYPKWSSVLPTSFGNVIRSFENYPQLQYDIAAITLWPRFVPFIPGDHAAQVEKSKANVDFLINLSCLSYLCAFLTLMLGLGIPVPFAETRLFLLWVLRIVMFSGAGFLLYRAAIHSAAEWGDGIRTVFDLYRPAVLKALGFERVPETLDEEREIWRTVSLKLIYGDESLDPRPWIYRHKLRVEPRQAKLRVTRGVTIANNQRTVTIAIENTDVKDIDHVVVTDVIGENREYVWGSAKIDVNAHQPAVTDRIVFVVGRVPSASHTELSYATTVPAK